MLWNSVPIFQTFLTYNTLTVNPVWRPPLPITNFYISYIRVFFPNLTLSHHFIEDVIVSAKWRYDAIMTSKCWISYFYHGDLCHLNVLKVSVKISSGVCLQILNWRFLFSWFYWDLIWYRFFQTAPHLYAITPRF